MGSKGSVPASPDYASIIPLQERSNINQFNTMLGASRVNSVTPYGSQYWMRPGQGSQAAPGAKTAQGGQWAGFEPGQPNMISNPYGGLVEGAPAMIPNPAYTAGGSGGTQPFAGQTPAYQNEASQDPWTFVQQLSPEQQALYDQDLRIRQGQGNVSEGMLQNVSDVYSNPENFAGMLPGFNYRGSPEYEGQQWQGPGYQTNIGSREDAERAIYNRQMRYDQPLMERRRQQEQDRLTSMGFNVNDPGYSKRMDDVARAEDRYYADAVDRAILGGGQEATAELGRGLAAEHIAQIEIADACGAKPGLQGILAELGLVAGVGRRTDIEQIRDLVGLEHGHEILDGARAIADRIDGGHIGGETGHSLFA